MSATHDKLPVNNSRTENSGNSSGGDQSVSEIWDLMPLNDLYAMVVEIYRKVGKDQAKMDYHQRVMLLAYYKQEKYGTYAPDKDTNVGYFDLVGSDRRRQWRALGNLSKEEAQREFINLLLTTSEGRLGEWITQRIEEKRIQEEIRIFQMVQQKINNGQIPAHMLQAAGANMNSRKHHGSDVPDGADNNIQSVSELLKKMENGNGEAGILSASLWCKPNAARDFIRQAEDGKETRLEVGRGEIVTIRVGTSVDAFAIFWEFVTENYDIGFGLGFVPDETEAEQSSEVELLPVTRRDCSVDVVMGNHQYNTGGTYLLKFDNSYSLLRSKVVYYKVYYHKPTLEQ